MGGISGVTSVFWIPGMNKLIPISESVCSGLVEGWGQGLWQTEARLLF